jgi:hypothetical protein
MNANARWITSAGFRMQLHPPDASRLLGGVLLVGAISLIARF